jgi:hypothetical protein
MSDLDDVEDALLALLASDPPLAALEGPPQLTQPTSPGREAVWIYERADVLSHFDTTGNAGGSKTDTMTFRVGVFVAKLTSPQTESVSEGYIRTRTRLSELTDRVKALVRANIRKEGTWDMAEVSRVERGAIAWGNHRGLTNTVYIDFDLYAT